MKGIKTLLATMLVVMIGLNIKEETFAFSQENQIDNYSTDITTDAPMEVYCPEFPDAYIIIEKNNLENLLSLKEGANDEVNLGTVKATVFVEESYGVEDGKRVITNSRLLSKEEVDAIGVENFGNIQTRAASNSRGKLTITFSGSYGISGNSVTCNLNGNAKWSGFNLFASPIDQPAVGRDFCGFVWGGDFYVTQLSASAQLSGSGMNWPVTLENATPTSGRVWSFDEFHTDTNLNYCVSNADFFAQIHKNSMTGNGNVTEAILQYIHTYQVVTGGISVSDSSLSYSLSNTEKQWSLVCSVYGIPY